jgi:hypothetical protein
MVHPSRKIIRRKNLKYLEFCATILMVSFSRSLAMIAFGSGYEYIYSKKPGVCNHPKRMILQKSGLFGAIFRDFFRVRGDFG